MTDQKHEAHLLGVLPKDPAREAVAELDYQDRRRALLGYYQQLGRELSVRR
jgi:hypothetical protein